MAVAVAGGEEGSAEAFGGLGDAAGSDAGGAWTSGVGAVAGAGWDVSGAEAAWVVVTAGCSGVG